LVDEFFEVRTQVDRDLTIVSRVDRRLGLIKNLGCHKKAKWFYLTNHHPELPKPNGKQPKHQAWWKIEPTMQEGIQLPELLQKIKALREAGPRAEHMAFSFMKRRVQPLMARDTLGYQYTGDEDTSRMPGNEVDDEDIVEQLGRIFKDMPPYTPGPVLEYSSSRPSNKVSS
jgi:hypothetical protein